jgi:hypothetical protein
MSHIPKESIRCEFIFPSGRRCRQVRTKPGACYCSTHGTRQQQQEETARIGDEIVGAEGALNTPDGIHKALANVFSNLARNRISARNAAVLGYVGQLMLVHCPSLERMIQSYLPIIQIAMKTKQQMDQSGARADRHERHLVELQFDLLDRILLLARSDEIKNMPDEARRQISEAIAAAFKKEGAPASAKP